MEEGLFADAQRFFVLTQTDNMWKEHLQVCMLVKSSLPACLRLTQHSGRVTLHGPAWRPVPGIYVALCAC